MDPIERIERTTLLDAPIFTAHRDRMRKAADGREFDFFVMETPDWVNVIALTGDARIVLIEQYRHGREEITTEIPGGMIDAGETPLEAARRELSEETGYTAASWEEIGWVEPNPAFQTNRTFTFLARGAVRTGEQHMDENEDIAVFERPLADMPDLLASGRIRHALVWCAFMHLAQRGEFDPMPGRRK